MNLGRLKKVELRDNTLIPNPSPKGTKGARRRAGVSPLDS
jgi:hypothetical protein